VGVVKLEIMQLKYFGGVRMTVLLIIAVVLFVLWLLGFSTRFVTSGAIHIVLVIALVIFVFWLLRGGLRVF